MCMLLKNGTYEQVLLVPVKDNFNFFNDIEQDWLEATLIQ